MSTVPVWLGALIGVAALLVAAKAHGRQVRLEREAAGYHEVVFGGTNPPFVDALWRADRFRFRDFAPRRLVLQGEGKPQHIRLDQALEVLLGDRLR